MASNSSVLGAVPAAQGDHWREEEHDLVGPRRHDDFLDDILQEIRERLQQAKWALFSTQLTQVIVCQK